MTNKQTVAIKVQNISWSEGEFKRAYRKFVSEAMQRGPMTEAERRLIGISPTPKPTVTVVAVEVLATAA